MNLKSTNNEVEDNVFLSRTFLYSSLECSLECFFPLTHSISGCTKYNPLWISWEAVVHAWNILTPQHCFRVVCAALATLEQNHVWPSKLAQASVHEEEEDEEEAPVQEAAIPRVYACGCALCQRNEYSEWRTLLFQSFSQSQDPRVWGDSYLHFVFSKNPFACKTVIKEVILIQRSEGKMATQKILMALRVMVKPKLRLLPATPPRRLRLGQAFPDIIQSCDMPMVHWQETQEESRSSLWMKHFGMLYSINSIIIQKLVLTFLVFQFLLEFSEALCQDLFLQVSVWVILDFVDPL